MIKLLNMFQISDSAFPIGSFTLSNGLETFTQKDKLSTAKDLEKYVENYVSFMKYNELGFLNLLCNAEFTVDNLILLDNMYSAIRSPREIREGSARLCKRFIKTWQKIEKLQLLDTYSDLISQGLCEGHHTICVALFIKEKNIDFEAGANIYAYSTVSAIITNAVKNVPLSQLDGSLILNKSFEMIEKAVKESKNTTIGQLGIGGTGFEIYSYNHETLYSRLYMS
ncbi:MAG: urease accessory UreF family protein [Clostridia bacterium]